MTHDEIEEKAAAAPSHLVEAVRTLLRREHGLEMVVAFGEKIPPAEWSPCCAWVKNSAAIPWATADHVKGAPHVAALFGVDWRELSRASYH